MAELFGSIKEGILHCSYTKYKAIWKPKEDITVFELAECIPYVDNYQYVSEYMLPKESLRRHFEIIKMK